MPNKPVAPINAVTRPRCAVNRSSAWTKPLGQIKPVPKIKRLLHRITDVVLSQSAKLDSSMATQLVNVYSMTIASLRYIFTYYFAPFGYLVMNLFEILWLMWYLLAIWVNYERVV